MAFCDKESIKVAWLRVFGSMVGSVAGFKLVFLLRCISDNYTLDKRGAILWTRQKYKIMPTKPTPCLALHHIRLISVA